MKLLKTVPDHALDSTLKSSLGKYHIISSLFMDGWKCDGISDLETEINSSCTWHNLVEQMKRKGLKMTASESGAHHQGSTTLLCWSFLVKGVGLPGSEEDIRFWQASPFQQYH